MKRRLHKQARKLLWLVDGDYAAFAHLWPRLWARLLREAQVPPGA